VSTGETYPVREFCDLAFGHLGLDYNDHVVIDERFFRPAEVDLLVGDAEQARTELGWKPEVSFEQMIVDMVTADIDLIRSQPRGMWPLNVRYT